MPWYDKYKQVSDNTSRSIPLPTGKSISTNTSPYTQNQFLSLMEKTHAKQQYDKQQKQKRISQRKNAELAVDKNQPFTLPSGKTKKFSEMDFREKRYVEGTALENRGRIFPNEESIIDDLNPLNWIASMAGNMSKAPYEAQQSNSNMPYATALAEPLLMGRVLGSGTINPFSKKMWTNSVSDASFVNSLGMGVPGLVEKGVNKAVQSTESGLLSNAYKLNPWKKQFNNPNAFYRQVDDLTFKEGLESGLIKGKQNINMESPTGTINLNKSFGDDAYYKKGSLYSPRRADYIYEVKKAEDFFTPKVNNRTRGYTTENTSIRVSKTPIPINEANVYKKDWLQGYKQVEVPKSNFKSEIDWGKWNKEIPNNKSLMQEYNAIEQQAKANGTWMKNPDGSAFQGTPEQFVQQNSSNFKKAFPEGSENVFRGTGENIAELRPNRSTFTANQELASGYAPFNKKSNFLNSESVEGGVHSFYRKNSKNSLELDANNTSWTSVDLSNRRLTKDYFERNIKSQEDQITKQKEYLSKMKQNPNGSWEAPDGTTYSNDLYKNTVAERELYLKDLKERYKNIDNLISNPKELEEMRKVLGNTTTTDDIAAYVEKRNLDYVKLKNIEDSGVGDVTIVNHKPGNYLKSAIGNNGMFDMNNPNIYKALVPAAIATGAATQEYKDGGQIDNKGYTGLIKSKIALGNALGNPAAKRMVSPNPKTGTTPEGEGTHYMSTFDNYAVPLLQDDGSDVLQYNPSPSPSKEDFEFRNEEEANYFANHYKQVAPMMRNWTDKYKN